MNGYFRHTLTVVAVATATGATIICTAIGVNADTLVAAPQNLNTVIGNITKWLVGLLVAIATLYFTIGGIRYLLAGGDPGEIGKAKDTLKYAAIGYGIAVLAPVLVKILQSLVGG